MLYEVITVARPGAIANEARFYLRRALLAVGPEPDSAPDMPLCPVMLAICDRSAGQIWCDQGWMVGAEAANALPSLGRAWL